MAGGASRGPERPPIGGLGAGAPEDAPIGPLPTPPSRGPLPPVLIIGAALFALLGAGASLAVFGLRSRIAAGTTAEARASLVQIAKDSVAAYERESGDAAGPAARQLCPSAVTPIPASLSSVAGKKYQSTAEEWRRDPAFGCLRFEMSAPQRYQYDYRSEASAFVATARGDLDGDGVPSTYVMRGRVEDDQLRLATSIEETLPDE